MRLAKSSNQNENAQGKLRNAFEKFGDAPKRGISVLDALNATIIQSTGGFAALGPASIAASTGLRAALFGLSNLAGPTIAITVGLAALSAIMLLTRDRAKEMSEALNTDASLLAKFASTAGPNAALAYGLIESKLRAINKLLQENEAPKQKEFSFWEKLGMTQGPIGSVVSHLTDYGKRQEETAKETLKLTAAQEELGRINLSTIPTLAQGSASASAHAEKLKLLTEGIAANVAQSSSLTEGIDRENKARLDNVGLLILEQELLLRNAKTKGAATAAAEAEIALLRKQRDEILKSSALTPGEEVNIKKQSANKVLEVHQNLADQEKKLDTDVVRRSEQLYRELSSTIVSTFQGGFSSIESMFGSMLKRLAASLIESGLTQLMSKIFGGGALGLAGINPLLGLGLGIGGLIFGGLLRPSSPGLPAPTGSGRTTTVPLSSLAAPSGGGSTVIVQVNALDTRSMRRAIEEEVVPILQRIVASRGAQLA